MESAKRQGSATEDSFYAPSGELDFRPLKTKRSNPQAASQRHIKTEQARRDKISAGFQALQELLPGKEKVEKAMLLTQAAEYISQLQAVLQMMISNGTIGKLPDEVQWQIRTLLPRKETPLQNPKASASASGTPPPAEAPVPSLPPASSLPGGLTLPVLPLLSQAGAMPKELPKEMSKDESALMAEVQATLQRIQQQSAATQQLQNYQQILQNLQIQQVLNQQAGSLGPDLISGLAGLTAISNPLASLPLSKGTSMETLEHALSATTKPAHSEAWNTSGGLTKPEPTRPVPRSPGSCYANELPKCGLQQLVEAACEPSCGARSPSTPPKARKNVKVRRHTTAAKIPKPDSPNPTRVGPGRPEPV